MKLNSRFIFILVLGLLMTVQSCKKKSNGPRCLTGHIIEFGSNKLISGATVTLREEGGDLFGLSTSKIIATQLSDANGFYQFDFYMETSKNNYAVKAEKDNYIDDLKRERVNYIGRKPVTDVTLTPYAYLRLRMIGNKGGPKAYAGLTGYPLNPSLYSGMDSTFIIPTRGNQWNNLRLSIYNGVAITYDEYHDFYFPAFDTINHTFEF